MTERRLVVRVDAPLDPAIWAELKLDIYQLVLDRLAPVVFKLDERPHVSVDLVDIS